MVGKCHHTFVKIHGLDTIKRNPNVKDGRLINCNASGGDADVREAVHVWRQGVNGNILDFLLRFCCEPKTAFFFFDADHF